MVFSSYQGKLTRTWRRLAPVAFAVLVWTGGISEARAVVVDYEIAFTQTSTNPDPDIGLTVGVFSADTSASGVSVFSFFAQANDVDDLGPGVAIFDSSDSGTVFINYFTDFVEVTELSGSAFYCPSSCDYVLDLSGDKTWRVHNNISVLALGTYDFAPAAVPMPPALILFASALVAFLSVPGVGRRRRSPDI